MHLEKPNTKQRLERALRIIARVVTQRGGRVYTPIYERIEAELAVYDRARDTQQRARRLLEKL